VSDDRGSSRGQFGMVNSELRIAFFLLATADCLLLTADCLLHLRGVGAGGTYRPHSSLGQNVFSTGREETAVTSKIGGPMRECL
jgi:hypothetical protein